MSDFSFHNTRSFCIAWTSRWWRRPASTVPATAPLSPNMLRALAMRHIHWSESSSSGIGYLPVCYLHLLSDVLEFVASAVHIPHSQPFDDVRANRAISTRRPCDFLASASFVHIGCISERVRQRYYACMQANFLAILSPVDKSHARTARAFGECWIGNHRHQHQLQREI